MNNNAPQRYQEINLVDLLWHICSFWRTLIVAMVVVSLLAGSYQIYRNIAGNRTAESQAEDLEQASDPADVFKSLTPTEQSAVENALVYGQQLQTYLDYQEKSVYINLDPYHENVRIVRYILQAEDADNEKEEMSVDALAGLLRQSYVTFINSGAAAGRLAEEFDDVEQVFIGELLRADELSSTANASSHQTGSFTVNGATTTFQVDSGSRADKGFAMFQVRVLGRTEAEVKKLAEAADKVLREYFAELTESLGQHTVEQLDSTASVIMDSGLISARQGFQANLIGARNNFNGTIAAFTEDQKTAYEHLSGNTENSKDTVALENVEIVPVTSGLIKYMLLGLFAGLMLAAVVIAMAYVLTPTLKTSEDLTRGFQYYLMADFSSYQETKKRLGAAIDRFLHRLRYRDQLSQEEEQRLLATNVRVTCKKEDITAVYFTSSCRMSEGENGMIQKLIADLKGEGITASYGGSIERDAESYERMTDTGAVIYVEKLGKSRFDSLENIDAMTQKQGVKILGVVAV